MPWRQVEMQIGYKSDAGQVREHNEDSLLCLKFDAEFNTGTESAGLFVVADGMGGHNAGEVASQLAVRTFAKECLSRLLVPPDKAAGKKEEGYVDVYNLEDIMASAVKEANKVLFDKNTDKNALQGMGTTLTAALITGQDLYVIHIGDSRCYIINDRETIEVTEDHSMVQEMVGTGMISPEEAKIHPHRNVITRVVGYYQEVEADCYRRKLYDGDRVLLCSDGLCGTLSDQEITKIALAAETAQQACNKLIDRANELGGTDNVSVIVVSPSQLPSWQQLLTADTQARTSEDRTS
jgi:serine/threonine protein phosphatase PrpC